MNSKTRFFEEIFPKALVNLKENTPSEWGVMSAPQMVDHLRKGILISLKDEDREVAVPPGILAKSKAFLLSDKPFKQNLPAPDIYGQIESTTSDFLECQRGLLKATILMLEFFKEKPNFSSVHPSFGRLTTQEWLHLHKKHITHHFRQFSLILS